MNVWDVPTVRDYVEGDHAIHSSYIGMSIGHIFGLLTHYIGFRKLHLMPTRQMNTPRVSIFTSKSALQLCRCLTGFHISVWRVR